MRLALIKISLVAGCLITMTVPAFSQGLVLKKKTNESFEAAQKIAALKLLLEKRTSRAVPDLINKSGKIRKDSTAAGLFYPRPALNWIKYDTTPQNPEHRCYDFRRSLTKNYTFVFNFLSFRKYNLTPF